MINLIKTYIFLFLLNASKKLDGNVENVLISCAEFEAYLSANKKNVDASLKTYFKISMMAPIPLIEDLCERISLRIVLI